MFVLSCNRPPRQHVRSMISAPGCQAACLAMHTGTSVRPTELKLSCLRQHVKALHAGPLSANISVTWMA